MNKVLVFWVAVLFLFCGSTAVFLAAKSRNREEPVNLPVLERPPLTDFVLTERSGKKFRSKDLRGKVWVASFFFASCPMSCTKQNMKVQELQEEFGPKGVTFVSITCDPETDTPLVLAEYADRFGADEQQWLFLTGNQDYIQRVGKDIFQVSVEPNTHSEQLMVVDREGKLRHYFHWGDATSFAELKTFLGEMLAEGSDKTE